MRLIDTETGEFVEFFDLSKIPPYAILSHTWEPPPIREQSYQDVVTIQKECGLGSNHLRSALPRSLEERRPPSSIFLGLLPLFYAYIYSVIQVFISLRLSTIWDLDSGLSEKIQRACEIARCDGYRYIWIDSCCIDKTSSSKLSEAINSMFNWYRGAQICYAFLVDVPSDEDVRAKGSTFRISRWFRRGWTLQELVAPRVVVFLSRDWDGLGTKDALADVIGEITHITCEILTHEKALSDESVAECMRWAAGRTTTREEDQAYSLLGIFGITMPTIYGEGRYAFQRLQEEILQRIPDQSLLAWGSKCLTLQQLQETRQIRVGFTHSRTPFAPSPDSFRTSESPRGRAVRTAGY
ncbi:hypothetical protein GSI_13166 [Ganoderma sinense ZZ0214-1]|uniref:Uncharacterized protein n=1 Tax=Ganoderma sinense ZZ0214-1 TaxID=1077348 RepID=A0A2G8RUT8_9APHY|nr:hypothetical protein GSI_13166 [Ganoderma sinense ZZ0214-1]